MMIVLKLFFIDNSIKRSKNYEYSTFPEDEYVKCHYFYNQLIKTKTHLYYSQNNIETLLLERKIKLQNLYDKM